MPIILFWGLGTDVRQSELRSATARAHRRDKHGIEYLCGSNHAEEEKVRPRDGLSDALVCSATGKVPDTLHSACDARAGFSSALYRRASIEHQVYSGPAATCE